MERALGTSPLSERAWVFQEDFLSRRTVHFTKHGLVWTCHPNQGTHSSALQYMISEYDEHERHYFDETWMQLVQGYSKRKLTYMTDKLIAIEGMRDQFQRKHRRSIYRYGLWLDDLPHGLLWHSAEPLVRDVPDVPSWSWAANTGAVQFQVSSPTAGDRVCGKISPLSCSKCQNEHLMIAGGKIRLVDEIKGSLQCQAFEYEDLLDMDFQGRVHDQYATAGDQYMTLGMKVDPTFLLLSGQEKVGWAVFDTFEAPNGALPLYCLGLVRLLTGPREPDPDAGDPIWVLLLQPQATATEDHLTFERVRWGLVLAPFWIEAPAPYDVILA